MSKEEQAGFKVDIPQDALAEAIQSVEKYGDKEDARQAADNGPEVVAAQEQSEPVVRVEIEDPDDGVVIDSDEYTSLKSELEKARQEFAALKDRMYRVAADADNIRKRAMKEREEGLRFGQEGLLRDLLPVVDNLERTLAHVPMQIDEPAFGALREGVQMVLKHFISILESHGVKSFDSVGKKFDPKLHEALSSKETSEAAPGTILNEMNHGFMLHDRLLRPALVVVACLPENEKNADGQDDACIELANADASAGEDASSNPDEETDSSFGADES